MLGNPGPHVGPRPRPCLLCRVKRMFGLAVVHYQCKWAGFAGE